ncbi:hypothetical protein OIU77_027443 [Salix suchowensis]|uniref:Uncharacterized protein n=1 Tax=Salix suchowensis TaxID=1278906 RepID=A0ABQ9BSE6_9ROSI|nr:hypothetical protein OIU77_027443 [Salix suchowensis]
MIVAVKPKPPAKHLRDGFDDDDDLKFQLPQSASRWKKRFYFFLHDKLKVPDILLMGLFSLSLKAWAVFILWFILAPVAHRWDLGTSIYNWHWLCYHPSESWAEASW